MSVSASPSPTEELEEDMPASSELASILKTLKRVEQNVKCKSANTFSHMKFGFWLYCSIGLKKLLALDMCSEGYSYSHPRFTLLMHYRKPPRDTNLTDFCVQ